MLVFFWARTSCFEALWAILNVFVIFCFFYKENWQTMKNTIFFVLFGLGERENNVFEYFWSILFSGTSSNSGQKSRSFGSRSWCWHKVANHLDFPFYFCIFSWFSKREPVCKYRILQNKWIVFLISMKNSHKNSKQRTWKIMF